jgi:signal transduction histidine kinase
VSESLTNVARHAGADRCTVVVDEVDHCLRLAVQDDGAGMSAVRSGGHGLGSMRRRAADLGGYITIEPLQPRGTSVTAVLPLETL